METNVTNETFHVTGDYYVKGEEVIRLPVVRNSFHPGR